MSASARITNRRKQKASKDTEAKDMNTFNGKTVKQFWNLGTKQRLQLLQAVYGNVMDYMAEDEYDSLPYGVQQRLETLVKVLENKRVIK